MQNIRRLVVPLLLTMVLLVAGCAGQAKKDATTAYEGSQPQLAPADVYEEKSVHMTEASQTADGERMVISTVKLVILVDDTNVTLTELRSLVQAQQGYISNSQQWLSNEQPYAHVTLRVPAESLNATLDAIRGLALRVQSESIAGEDVTEEYINLDARLSHLEETQKELLALLAETAGEQHDPEGDRSEGSGTSRDPGAAGDRGRRCGGRHGGPRRESNVAIG